VEGQLGAGGFGAVFAAVRLEDGRRAAVKLARADAPGAAAQLRAEEEALRAVGPPAVPAVLGSGSLAGGTPWVAMELLPGTSLAAVLEQAAGPLPVDVAGRLALALLDALAAVHAAGLAHGDLKPENVFVDGAPPRARLLDLGLARRLGAPQAAPSDHVAGTPEYMAPEQCEGHPPDAQSDVYAAGAILYEMLVGRPPFFGPEGVVRQAQVNVRPPRPSGVVAIPEALEAAVLAALAKRPGERPASAGALRAQVASALDAAATLPRADPPGVAPHAVAAPLRPQGSPAAAVAAATPTRRTVAILFLESPAEATAVQSLATTLSGKLAHAQQRRYAIVFDASTGDNPVSVAVRAGRMARARQLADRAVVHRSHVTVVPRAGGGERFLSPLFTRDAFYPGEGGPSGVLATREAADLLLDERLESVEDREGLRRVVTEDAPEAATVVRQASAPLLGRDGVLSDLVALASTTRQEGPTLVTVVGDAGVGKTHLGAALAERLRGGRSPRKLVELRGRPGGGEVLSLLALAVVGGARSATIEGREALLRSALPPAEADAWPGLALALGWLEPDAPELRAWASAPGALAALVRRTVGEVLRLEAARQPLCIVLDDAHLADPATLDALEYAALAEEGADLFACALARPSFSEARSAWGERSSRRRCLSLGPLPAADAAELCRQLLLPAENVPGQAILGLVERAQGVPRLLVELVAGLKREGLVRRHPTGGASYLATDEIDRVPDMPIASWLAQRDVERLPRDLEPHAWLAALLAPEVAAGEVVGVLAELDRSGHGDRFPLDPAAATRRLLGLGLLVAHRGGHIGFRVPVVRDEVARAAPAALARAVHEAAARLYERPGLLAEGERLSRLAHHLAAAGRTEEAADVELSLGRRARDRHAYLEAETLFSRVLDHLPGGPSRSRVDALRGRGLMRYRTGRYDESVADLEAARRAARDLGDASVEVECLLDEATSRDWARDFPGSRARVEEVRALAPEPTPLLRARLLLGQGRSLFRESRWEEACVALEAARDLAGAAGDEGYETLMVALLMLGSALPQLGRAGEAAGALERAEALARERGDGLHLASALTNRRNLFVARGDLEGALRDQLGAVRLGRELGLATLEYYGAYNAAELCYQAADLVRAEQHLGRVREIEVRHPEAQPLALGLLLWARLRVFAGDLAGARERLAAFRGSVEAARAAGWRGVEPGPSDVVLADAVDLATRGATPAEWDELCRRSAADSVEQEPIEVLEMRGLSALRGGRLEEGRRAMEEALHLAERIPNLLAPRVRRALAAAGPP
jgi:tetratricopeptide (TPR) repeat protein/nicotinamide riboside kinase